MMKSSLRFSCDITPPTWPRIPYAATRRASWSDGRSSEPKKRLRASRDQARVPVAQSASSRLPISAVKPCTPASQSEPYAGRNMNCSVTMTAFDPARSSVPWEHAFAVMTVRRVSTARPASITRGSRRLPKTSGPNSGAAATQSIVPAAPPTKAIDTSVAGNRGFSRSGPARKYGAAIGSPEEMTVPMSPGSTWRRA